MGLIVDGVEWSGWLVARCGARAKCPDFHQDAPAKYSRRDRGF